MDVNKVKQVLMENTRIKCYFAMILVCSLMSLPDEYRVDKRNPLNQWFVKLGWFWTTIFIIPLMYITTGMGDRQAVSQAVFRLFLSSALWFVSVNSFQIIDDATGFDISGHTFLLMFSNLIIASELRHCKHCIQLSIRDSHISNHSLESRRTRTAKLPLLLLSALWDFMLLQTALYYHTLLQKAIAMVWASGSWYIMEFFFYKKATDIKT